MGQFSARQRIEIALIWVLGLLFLYLQVVSPVFTVERASAIAERTAAEAALADMESYQRTLRDDVQAEAKLRARQARLADALPEERGQGAFVHAVEHLAQRSGVTIEAFEPRMSEQSGAIVIQPIVLKFHGNYFDVLTFLRAVQEQGRSVSYGDFTLTAEGNGLHCVLLLRIATRAAE